MSLEGLSVSFKLQSGEIFDGIRVENVEWTLAEFVDENLKRLENESRIQLPYMEGDLVDLETFKVYDGKRENQLDLTTKLVDLGYLSSCREKGETPCFYLVSNIFMNSDQVEREERVNNVLRQQEGQSTNVEREPPSIPERTTSIDAQVTSNDELLYLAGRKPYEPRPLSQRAGSPSISSLTSEGNVLPGSVVGQLLEGSTASLSASEDSASLHSATSLHRSVAKRNSDSELNNQREPPFPEAANLMRRSASEKSNRRVLRHTASMPPNPTVNITIEEDRVSCGGLSNITEGEEMTGGSASDQSKRSSLASVISRRSRERESSPGVLDRPNSPEGGVSPGSSPRTSRKRRFASKRQMPTKRNLFSDSKSAEGGGASASAESESGATVATETDGQALAPSLLSRRNMRRTIYAKSRVVASSFLPMRIFGNIKTFQVEFEIPIAEVSIQMEIRGDYSVGQIKDNLWNYMREQDLMMEEYGAIWDPENFTFTYKMNGETYELYDEQQILYPH